MLQTTLPPTVLPPATTARCSAGDLRVPVLYRDGALLALLYGVDLAAAASLVPRDLVEPLTLAGRAFAMLVALEYRDSTVGPYNELAVGVYVKRRNARASALRALLAPGREPNAGGWVVTLPVTTSFASAAGRELWGYPKYIAAIDTDFATSRARVSLGGELTLECDAGRGLRLPGAPFVTLSRCGERLLRTRVAVHHAVRFGGAGSARLSVVGDGPTAEVVRRLGLHERRPITAFRTDALRTVLPMGEVVAG
jgi:hypothetical protein